MKKPKTLTECCDCYCAGQGKDEISLNRTAFRALGNVLGAIMPDVIAPGKDGDLDAWLAVTPCKLLEDRVRILRALKDLKIGTQLGVVPNTWRQYRSRIRKILTWYKKTFMEPKAQFADLSQDWQGVRTKLCDMHQNSEVRDSCFLSKFIVWNSLQENAVVEVNADATKEFREWLFEESQIKEPERYYSMAAKDWKKMAEQGFLPSVEFYKRPDEKLGYGAQWSDLEAPFKEAFEEFARRSQSSDPDVRFNKNPSQSSTIEARRRTYCEFLGAVQSHLNVDMSSIEVAELFRERKYLEAYRNLLLKRSGGKVLKWHQQRLNFLTFFANKFVEKVYGPVDVDWVTRTVKRTPGERAKDRKYYGRDVVMRVVDFITAEINAKLAQGASINTLFTMYRDRFMIQHFVDRASRQAELRNAKMGEGVIVSDSGVWCDFVRKNRVRNPGWMSAVAKRYFDDYLDFRKQLGVESDFVLVSKYGRPLMQNAVYAQVKRWFERAVGIDFSPHMFRHSLATDDIQKHGSLDRAAILLGDGSIDVVNECYYLRDMQNSADRYYALMEELISTGFFPTKTIELLVSRAQQDRGFRKQLLAALEVNDAKHANAA